MADSQVSWGVAALSGAISEPAWKTKPSWYLVVTEDRMIPPAAQRSMSKRAGSTVVEVKGSHAIYVSQPGAVAALIEKAARVSRPPALKPALGRKRPNHRGRVSGTRRASLTRSAISFRCTCGVSGLLAPSARLNCNLEQIIQSCSPVWHRREKTSRTSATCSSIAPWSSRPESHPNARRGCRSRSAECQPQSSSPADPYH
jgi:hypothetical protein